MNLEEKNNDVEENMENLPEDEKSKVEENLSDKRSLPKEAPSEEAPIEEAPTAEAAVEEESSDRAVEIEEDVKEKPIVNTEREIPPIITPKEEPQSGEQEPKITQAIPVEDIDDIEQEKDPEIAVREKVEVERFSEDDED